MRKAIFPALLVVALSLAACGTRGPTSGRSTPEGAGSFTSLLHHVGATLCPVGRIDPALQGGSETVEIYSFSTDKTCTPRATAHQGLIYFVENIDGPSTRYFLGLASVGGGFQAGWRSGHLAIVVSSRLPVLRLFAIEELFRGHATPVFGVARHS